MKKNVVDLASKLLQYVANVLDVSKCLDVRLELSCIHARIDKQAYDDATNDLKHMSKVGVRPFVNTDICHTKI